MADIRVDIQQATLVQDVANTTQNISLTAGFGTPKAVMIVRTGFQPGATGFWGNNNFSIGVYDGTNEFCISGMIDGQGTPFNIIDATSSHSNITIGRHIQVGPFQVPEEAFTLESWGEDLVTIKTTVATNDVGDLPWKITVIAFGGSSLLNASVVEKDDLRTGTDQININVGHKTSAAFFLSANTSTPLADFDDVTKAGEEILKASFGIALNKSGTPQRCMAWGAVDDSDPTDYTMYLANDAVMASVLSGSLNYKVSVTEWTDTKIGVTPSASASNAILGLLCLEYDDDTDFNLIDIAFPASGDYSETGIGFTSTLGMLCSASGVSSRNTATSADGAVNICAFNSTDIWSSNWSCESGITADPFTAHSGYHLKLLIADPTPASNPTAVVESSDNTITSTGWDFTLSTTSAVLGFAFALGERVAPLEKDVTKSAYSHTYTDGTTKIHAGSKMQIGHNLGKVFYYDDTQAFINMVKGGKLRTNTTLNSPDANGYIDSTGGGDWDHTLHTGEFLLPGKYVCRWTGTCTVTLRTTSGSDITPDPPDTTPNRHEYTLTATDGGLYLRMESGTCTNLEFLGPGLAEETNYDNGNILTTTFKNDLAGITCIRCMDWLQINDAPIRNVADMSDYNYIVWINDEAGYPDIVGGVPFRVIAEAAEELDVDLWVNTHHQMVDAAVTAAANEVWNNLSAGWKASHRIYVEYSNELWNSSFHDAWSWIRHLGGGPLVDATMTPSTGSVSSTTHGLTTGDRIVCHWNTTHDDSPYSRGFEIRVVRDDANTFRVTYGDNADVWEGNMSLINATQANPCALTITDPAGLDLANGDTVHVGTGGGMVELEGSDYTVANLQSNTPSAGQTTFELSGVNSTGFTAYSSGGECYKMVPPTYIDATATLLSYRVAETVSLANTCDNLATRCTEVWDLFEAVTGTGVIYRVGSGQTANFTWYTNQLTNNAWRESYDFYALAPYVHFRDAADITTMTLEELTDYMIDTYAPSPAIWMGQNADNAGIYRLICYEGGEENGKAGWNATEEAKIIEWARSTEATRFYDFYCKWLADYEIQLFMNYLSHSSYNKFGTWGLMETAGQTTAAEYLGVKPFLDGGGAPKS